MVDIYKKSSIEKLPSGIKGIDTITNGGFPKGRTTLLSGSAGSAKTVFAVQFLAEGISQFNESGVFVTFEESPEDIRRNMMGFDWDIARWEAEGKFIFIDASPDPNVEMLETGAYDFGALLVRIEYAIKKIGAKRLSMDSLAAIFSRFDNQAVIRGELYRISSAIKAMNVTAIMTAERLSEYGEIARYGVEEFVTDNVVILRHILEEEKRRRTIEVLKFRGTTHQKGEFPFSIVPHKGIVGMPLSAIELKQQSSTVRINSGSEELDSMCGGGFFKDSIILVSGATGTGKTLMVTHMIKGGVESGQRCLLLAFEESRDQLFRNAAGWNVDFERYEKDGMLKVVCMYPEVAGLDDHLLMIKDMIHEFKPDRVAVDSLSALDRVSTVKGFREFVIGMTSFIKEQQIVGMFTSTTPTLTGGSSITEAHISTITDTIIMLRYVELLGEMRRGITVLKMRGSAHDKEIREFVIDETGMHIRKQFRNISGILAGTPHQISATELERMEKMFEE